MTDTAFELPFGVKAAEVVDLALANQWGSASDLLEAHPVAFAVWPHETVGEDGLPLPQCAVIKGQHLVKASRRDRAPLPCKWTAIAFETPELAAAACVAFGDGSNKGTVQ